MEDLQLWKDEKIICWQMEYAPHFVLCPSQNTIACNIEVKAVRIEKLTKCNIFSATIYKSHPAR